MNVSWDSSLTSGKKEKKRTEKNNEELPRSCVANEQSNGRTEEQKRIHTGHFHYCGCPKIKTKN